MYYTERNAKHPLALLRRKEDVYAILPRVIALDRLDVFYVRREVRRGSLSPPPSIVVAPAASMCFVNRSSAARQRNPLLFDSRDCRTDYLQGENQQGDENVGYRIGYKQGVTMGLAECLLSNKRGPGARDTAR